MTFQYLGKQDPEKFLSPNAFAAPVLLNTDKLKFALIAEPTLAEIRDVVEEYGNLRSEARWIELMEVASSKNATLPRIRLFQAYKGSFVWLPAEFALRLGMGTTMKEVVKRIAALSVDEQRELASSIKPNNIPEMLAFFRSRAEDQTGYGHLMSTLDKATSAFEFFGRLIDSTLGDVADEDYRLGMPKTGFHQMRVFEFLGMAVQRKWLLFPFIHYSSGLQEHYILLHSTNAGRYFHELYRAAETAPLFMALAELPAEKTTHQLFVKHLRHLVVCSTYRTVEQCSSELFERCLALIAGSEAPMAAQQVGMARRTYNNLIKLHNARPGAVTLRQVAPPSRRVSLDEYASFQDLRHEDGKWSAWADAFGAFVRASTDSQGATKKMVCREFSAFLATLDEPPLLPARTLRHHINDFTDTGRTYRNYLRQNAPSAGTANRNLTLLSQFFDLTIEQLRAQHGGAPEDTPAFQNPVDTRFDRFAENYKAGTKRKAIAAEVMAMMRNILVEDDFAWPKAISGKGDAAHLVDSTTGKLEYVWCPSATILLYTLLSVPLRGLQARLLDSGEGDAEIYDFGLGRMVPNPTQLFVDGRCDSRRREGVLQVMASGMLGVSDIVGLWITTNKTSDTGYAVPWVNEELLKYLRYQRDWVMRYAHHPKMHGISEAQGHRNTPDEWQERETKFYCLFRDPTVERVAEPSLPVSKQKLLKLWGQLCLETQKRINAVAKNQSERITLITPSTENNRYPTALFDLHTLRVSGITDLLDRGVPLNIVAEYVAGHATYIMTLWYDKPSPGMVREQLLRARASVGDAAGPLPGFSQDDLEELRPFLVANPNYKDMYTGFDAWQENKGLVLFRQSGICPGACCDEGGLDDNGRSIPVPVGDRGPSCPQCRFWLTGPAFLLGQTIEGNQLILKIRNKVAGLAVVRDKIMDAEDANNHSHADLLRGQADVEERQLNDMLTEWWHRMRFYEASVRKLDNYREAQRQKADTAGNGQQVVLLSRATEQEIRYGFTNCTELELKHFLSSCAEVLPEFTAGDTPAKQDIELAVGKFMAMNDERDLTHLFFKLADNERLTAANLIVELMLRALDPQKASDLLDGNMQLAAVPELQQEITRMLTHSQSKAFTLKTHEQARELVEIGASS